MDYSWLSLLLACALFIACIFIRKLKVDNELNAKSKENIQEVKASSTVEKSIDENKQAYIKKQQELEKSCNEFREKYRTAYDENQRLRSQNKQLDASIFELRKKVKNYEIIFENNKSASKYPCETVDTKKNKKIMENLADGYNNEKSKNKNLTEVIEFLKGQIEDLNYNLNLAKSDKKAAKDTLNLLEEKNKNLNLINTTLRASLDEKSKPIPPPIAKANTGFKNWSPDVHKQPEQILKIQRALAENMSIIELNENNAKIRSCSGMTYVTSLEDCSCGAFKYGHGFPCKHIYYLAENIGAFDCEKALGISFKGKITTFFDKLATEEKQSYPWVSQQIADYKYYLEMSVSYYLKTKIGPAAKSANTISEMAADKRAIVKQNKMLQYQLNFYESIFPWLEDFKEVTPAEAYKVAVETSNLPNNEYDSVKNWLSPEEYTRLPTAEKFQLALDKYNKRKKTNWQVGIEFERYIGYKYEHSGYKVTYLGATMGLEDMGRDLLALKGNQGIVIQCKRWAKEKTIHEKHIFQLYGTLILLAIENPNIEYIGRFITTAFLSEKAKSCADYLKIQYEENVPVSDYPMIKCNISKDGEKIYHLPFDQQYDRIVISEDKGECFVKKVAEAEQLGFRRAFKWKSDEANKNSK